MCYVSIIVPVQRTRRRGRSQVQLRPVREVRQSAVSGSQGRSGGGEAGGGEGREGGEHIRTSISRSIPTRRKTRREQRNSGTTKRRRCAAVGAPRLSGKYSTCFRPNQQRERDISTGYLPTRYFFPSLVPSLSTYLSHSRGAIRYEPTAIAIFFVSGCHLS